MAAPREEPEAGRAGRRPLGRWEHCRKAETGGITARHALYCKARFVLQGTLCTASDEHNSIALSAQVQKSPALLGTLFSTLHVGSFQ